MARCLVDDSVDSLYSVRDRSFPSSLVVEQGLQVRPRFRTRPAACAPCVVLCCVVRLSFSAIERHHFRCRVIDRTWSCSEHTYQRHRHSTANVHRLHDMRASHTQPATAFHASRFSAQLTLYNNTALTLLNLIMLNLKF